MQMIRLPVMRCPHPLSSAHFFCSLSHSPSLSHSLSLSPSIFDLSFLSPLTGAVDDIRRATELAQRAVAVRKGGGEGGGTIHLKALHPEL